MKGGIGHDASSDECMGAMSAGVWDRSEKIAVDYSKLDLWRTDDL